MRESSTLARPMLRGADERDSCETNQSLRPEVPWTMPVTTTTSADRGKMLKTRQTPWIQSACLSCNVLRLIIESSRNIITPQCAHSSCIVVFISQLSQSVKRQTGDILSHFGTAFLLEQDSMRPDLQQLPVWFCSEFWIEADICKDHSRARSC